MKKNVIIGLFAFVSLFMFTGCIDFLEEITYHRNGSGTYQFTVDMSQIKSLLDGLGEGESEDKKDPMKDMGDKFDVLEKKLEGIEGISHFKNINDTSTFVFGFSFDFKNAASLDKALHEQNDKLAASTQLFKGSKRLFTRFNKGSMAESMKNELAGEETEGTDKEQMEMVKSMFGDMKLRTIYHFDRRVKSSSNVNSTISADKKNVTLDYYFFKPELNKGDEGVGTVIKLKRR